MLSDLVDPAELIARLGDRVRLVHLKVGPCRAFGDDMVALGELDLDVIHVLAASCRYLESVDGGGPI